MRIKDLMKKPIVIEKDMQLSNAAKLMNKNSINSLIVEKEGNILGIITNHDLVKYFGESKNVSEIMTKNVITLRDKDPIKKAIELARDKNIGIFPVVDSKNKIVGIIDSKDLIKLWDNEDFLID